MAITYQSAGTAGTGTTTASPGVPASVAAGDLLVLCTGNKPYSSLPIAATPVFTRVVSRASGSVNSSVGAGSTRASISIREAAGTESGTISVSVTSGTPTMSQCLRFTKAATEVWSIESWGMNVPNETTAVKLAGDWENVLVHTWTARSFADDGTYTVVTVNDTNVLVSTDGETYTAYAVPAALWSIVKAGTGWWGAAPDGDIYATTNPTSTWTQAHDGAALNIQGSAYGMAYGNPGGVVYATAGGQIVGFPDGTTYTRIYSDNTKSWRGVAYDPIERRYLVAGYTVATGAPIISTYAGTSPRTGTWTTVTPTGLESLVVGSGIIWPIFGDGRWVMSVGGGYIAYCPRGEDPATATWSYDTHGLGSAEAIEFSNGEFILGGADHGLRVGLPGGEWRSEPAGPPGTIMALRNVGNGLYRLSSWNNTQAAMGRIDPVTRRHSAGPAATPLIKQGDVLVFCTAIHDDSPTLSSQAFTVSGATLTTTWLTKISTTSGNDGGLYLGYATVDSGAADQWPTFAATASASMSSSMSMVRLRAEAPSDPGFATTPRRRLLPALVR